MPDPKLDRMSLIERKDDDWQPRPGDAATWLELHHGPATRRPAASTRSHNEQMLRAFLTDFGARKLNEIGGRHEQLQRRL